ncbi:aminotransferase class I/II-fold pyridoxal phosphate-dependent enzyme [Hymenobacter gummosus]|uniref:Aminotransferase class I/II-fold pyridoxal phosphate-dependent enzyme n=1 Tax=Hymenobacter gummosus TaxID=1776032 RepID=A0A431U748_9BACT|nr:aminotransferase class I/II-fold pyridoxal phosphate-dependent enzyme [Hymenobacter gummosus]RTQ52508.1 aminotransferase class I/II-fold pyridoxal phosphate-dependent enzyme [Hymenobacter gummosus]
MADFTSALYLGARAVPWPAGLPLTSGRPAALHEPAGHRWVAREVARRQGLDAGVLAPSSLHLFCDVLTLLPPRGAVLLDEGLYPVGRWGTLRALLQGRPVHAFDPDRPAALPRLLHRCAQQGLTPWLLTDGWRTPAHAPAPLARYQQLLRPFPGAVLLIDDTQAFGVLGTRPDDRQPLGYGGGGSLPWAGLRPPAAEGQGPQLLTVTSLGKGLGVPVAVLAGPAPLIAQYRRRSEVRVHTSPVSELHAWAAAEALHHDARCGSAARQRLSGLVQLFRQTLAAGGLSAFGGPFPVQTLRPVRASAALALHQQLRQQGHHALLLAGPRPDQPALAFCLRADHPPAAVQAAARAVVRLARGTDWLLTPANPLISP